MGLTVHYRLNFPARLSEARAAEIVATAHRRSLRLARERHLPGVSGIFPADPENPLCCGYVQETHGGKKRGYDVLPTSGWRFVVDLGAGSESAQFGLSRYPATIRVGRRTLRTGCAGWNFGDFCKTQYASLHGEAHFLKCHGALIDLLLIWRELGAKLTVRDEGGYWPDRNESALLAEVRALNRLVAAVGGALKDAADEVPGATVEAPIFGHGQFELLEMQGLTAHGPRLAAAAARIRSTMRSR